MSAATLIFYLLAAVAVVSAVGVVFARNISYMLPTFGSPGSSLRLTPSRPA